MAEEYELSVSFKPNELSPEEASEILYSVDGAEPIDRGDESLSTNSAETTAAGMCFATVALQNTEALITLCQMIKERLEFSSPEIKDGNNQDVTVEIYGDLEDCNIITGGDYVEGSDSRNTIIIEPTEE